MTTNGSGKLNRGGVANIKRITTRGGLNWEKQRGTLIDACLNALAHRPVWLYVYQDWGPGGPEKHLADRGKLRKAHYERFGRRASAGDIGSGEAFTYCAHRQGSSLRQGIS